VNAAAIIIIAIAATGVLVMRFRKRWLAKKLAKLNIAFTNRITSLSRACGCPWPTSTRSFLAIALLEEDRTER